MKYVFPSPIFYSSENWVLEKWIFLKPHSWWVQDPCLNRFLLILKPCSLLLSCLSKIWISAHKYFSFHIYIYIYLTRYTICTMGVAKSIHACWWRPITHIPIAVMLLPFFWLQTLLALQLLSDECGFTPYYFGTAQCFKNVPFLTSRGDLPKCQSELIWMIFIAVPQGLELLACCFWMSYFDGR